MAEDLSAKHGDYLQGLPPRAQNLLLAAQRLLVEEGYEGLSWARVAKEAGEQKSTIAYYFGDKATLVSALLRVIGQGTSTWLVEQCEALPPGHDRIDAYLRVPPDHGQTAPVLRLLRRAASRHQETRS